MVGSVLGDCVSSFAAIESVPLVATSLEDDPSCISRFVVIPQGAVAQASSTKQMYPNESNKDEAFRCLAIARLHKANGNLGQAPKVALF
jgi:hypothetical protein